MSGHSKWATIKRAKGAADAKRSQLFTKLAKVISVAARDGADMAMNAKLRMAVDKARSFSMPKDNIERAIQKGAGASDGTRMEEIRYEAYAPGGVAMLIDVLTDNRNRTASEIRHLVERGGGRMAEIGSVSWMFEVKGLVRCGLSSAKDEAELALIEAGAEDISEYEGELLITCSTSDFERVKQAVADLGMETIYSSIEPVAKTTVAVREDAAAKKLEDLRQTLEENDDVTTTFDNEE